MNSDRSFEERADVNSGVPEPPESAKIHPLVNDRGNDRVLREWLAEHDTYRATDPEASPLEAGFDLCIVDAEGLQRNADELRRLKAEAAPVLCPVLLLLPEQRSEIVETDRGQIADNVFATTVDEIVSLPIRQTELEWRIRALLRLREQSRRLYDRTRELRRFREATEASGHAIYITDAEGTIEYVNPAFESLTGYSRSEAIGETPRLLRSEETPDSYYQELWETVQSGQVWQEEITNQRKDGEEYVAYQTIAPITGDPDTIAGEPGDATDGPESEAEEVQAFVAVQADVTEQKRLQRRLEQHREIVQRLEDPIMIQDLEGRFQLLNEAVAEFAGMPKEELFGTDEYDFMDEETASTIEAKKREVIETESPVAYELSPTFEHSDRDASFSTRRYPYYNPDGELAGTMAICRDVTELKERQQELRQFERAIEGATDLIAAVDREERYLFANPQYRAYHGLENADIRGLTLEDVIADRAYEVARGNVARALRGETVKYQTTREHPTRGDRILDTRYYPLEDDSGAIVGVVAVFRDVTDREERTRQLRVVDQILRHNLRNSLTVIRGEAERIHEETGGSIAEGAERIATHAGDLLTTSEKSRAITNVLSERAKRQPVDLATSIQAVVRSVSNSQPDASIETDCPERVIVSAIPDIDDAIEELLTNAVIHNDRETPTVELAVRKEEDCTAIVVADDGPGIPEMDRDVLETGAAIDDLYHGSGLGLWLVYWIVHRSGGSIEVTDREPRGSRVTVELPLVDGSDQG